MKRVPLMLPFLLLALRGQAAEPVRITLAEAIRLALLHNHNLLATRTTIEQSQAQEITAGLRPNPVLSGAWQPPPLFKPQEGSTQVGLGLSYTFELGKRGRRIEAARDATQVTRSQVGDSERSLALQVATQFINVQLAESTLELSRQNLKSFQDAVGISETRYERGSISENDFLKIKLQLLQFETDVQQAQLAGTQALSDLRQLLGYESVPPDYDVTGPFDHQPLKVDLAELQKVASSNRPDLRAAEQGLTAAESQHELAKVNARPDVTLSANYFNSAGLNVALLGVSVPVPIFDRNQGRSCADAVRQRTCNGTPLLDSKKAKAPSPRASRLARSAWSRWNEISAGRSAELSSRISWVALPRTPGVVSRSCSRKTSVPHSSQGWSAPFTSRSAAALGPCFKYGASRVFISRIFTSSSGVAVEICQAAGTLQPAHTATFRLLSGIELFLGGQFSSSSRPAAWQSPSRRNPPGRRSPSIR